MTTDNDLPTPDNISPCLNLGREDQVYDYYNGVLVGEEARAFEAHLLDCFTCGRTLATLDWVNELLKTEIVETETEPVTPDARAWRSLPAAPSPPAARNWPPLYLIIGGVGGLGILGGLAYGTARLFKFVRQRNALNMVKREFAS
ncbi:MAG TPA: hypothetical protein VGX48_21755 [Pyrinomonadaceae bacterium]|jgi:hypothetical protein|nr:hypothetical protein [Pyrinomonadaceae bacterium]